MTNPVLFYFWAHSEFEELITQTLENLVERADVLFLELVSHNLDSALTIEKNLNNGSQSRPTYFGKVCSHLLDLTEDTGKRYVIEKTLAPDFGVHEDFETSDAFFEYTLDTAMEIKADFLTKNVEYQDKREQSVAEQILAIKEMSLVLFGSGHLDLEKLVKKIRPTEVHYPYPDFPISYNIQMWQKFRKTKQFDKELYLRFNMEDMVRKALNDNYNNLTSRFKNLLAHHYAGVFTLEQILDYKDRLLFFSGLMSVPSGDIFESYLKNNDLPSIREVLEDIKA